MLGCDKVKMVVIIDPVLEFLELYQKIINERVLMVQYIIETHTHADHLSAATALKSFTDAKLVMSEQSTQRCVDKHVHEGDILECAGNLFKIIDTPGHARDGISVIVENKIFTGDALFLDAAGVGRDDLPGGNPHNHWESLQKITQIDDDLIVYPGHNYRNQLPSSLRKQKSTNPVFQMQDEKAYVSFVADQDLGPASWMKHVIKANINCTTDPKAAWIPIDTPSCEVLGTINPEINTQVVSGIPTAEFDAQIHISFPPLILDVRSSNEFRKGEFSIANAVNIPLTTIMNDLSSVTPYRDWKVITVCGSGKRAEIAAKTLKSVGFENPMFLKGGLKQWAEWQQQMEKSVS